MNIVILTGMVDETPEINVTEGRRRFATFHLSADRGDAGNVDRVKVVVWDKLADEVIEHVRLGDRIGVEGKLYTGTTAIEVTAQVVGVRIRPLAPTVAYNNGSLAGVLK